MFIPNYDTQNNYLCILQLMVKTSESNEPTNQNTIKVPKVARRRITVL